VFVSLRSESFPQTRVSISYAHTPLPTTTKPKTAIQFTAVLLWFACNRADGGGGLCVLGSFAPPLSLAAWLAALVLGGYGQALNVGIFRAIGRDGVYYGTRLGKRIPWVKGWPFDAALAHPQYVGSAMTVWAGALLMGGARPAGTAVLVTYWTLLYVVTALMEQYL
jgi:methylene-fatty-acyl-phospholipid synthase